MLMGIDGKGATEGSHRVQRQKVIFHPCPKALSGRISLLFAVSPLSVGLLSCQGAGERHAEAKDACHNAEHEEAEVGFRIQAHQV